MKIKIKTYISIYNCSKKNEILRCRPKKKKHEKALNGKLQNAEGKKSKTMQINRDIPCSWIERINILKMSNLQIDIEV